MAWYNFYNSLVKGLVSRMNGRTFFFYLISIGRLEKTAFQWLGDS